MTRLMNGEFAVTNYITTTIDFIHQDHSRSEPKRKLIAYDPAHARPEGRGLNRRYYVGRQEIVIV